MSHGAHGRVGVGHQCNQAILHNAVGVGSTGAPGIQWIHWWQPMIEYFLQPVHGGWLDLRQRYIHAVGQVDQELTLSTRIMDADQAAFCHFMRLGEHDQRRGQFVHVFDSLYAVSVEQGLVRIVTAGDCTGMGHGQPGG